MSQASFGQSGLGFQVIDYQTTDDAPGAPEFIALGNNILFSANSASTGEELWITNGTTDNESLLKDINPGPFGSVPFDFYDDGNGTVYFFAWTEETGYELWKTRGSAATTQLVKDINPGVDASVLYRSSFRFTFMGTYDDQVYFLASKDGESTQLWTTGGTTATTIELFDFGFILNQPLGFEVTSNGAYFTDFDNLYRTDGTPGGTFVLKSDIERLPRLTTSDEQLYFAVDDDTYGEELWTSDGTLAGTRIVSDITPGAANSSIGSGTAAFQDKLLFSVDDDLWVTDGTAANTNMIHVNVEPNNGSVVLGNQLVFSDRGVPWVTNGTAAGTHLLVDPATGIDLAFADFGVNVNGTLFFGADDGIHGGELWATNGTSAGTQMLRDITQGPESSFFTDWYTVNNRAFVINTDGKLHVSDGTINGTIQISEIAGNDVTNVLQAEERGSELFFYGQLEDYGYQFLRTNGAPNSSMRITDLGRREAGLDAATFADFNGYTYFYEQSRGFPQGGLVKIFKMNEEEIIPVIEHENAVLINRTTFLGVINNKLLYSINDVSGEFDLHALTIDDSHLVIQEDIPVSRPESVVTSDGIFFITGSDLYKTDGTASGTEVVALPAHTRGPDDLVFAGGKIYFNMTTAAFGNELWTTDGSASGTFMVKDITVGSSSSSPRIVGYNNSSLFFSVSDFVIQDVITRLWVTDGTPAGTLELKDGRTDEPVTAVSSNGTNQLNVLGSRVFFINEDGELWRSTGTTAGTLFVHDLDGNTDTRPSFLGRFNDELYFSTSNDGSHKIYKSNGSGGGTVQINEFQVGFGATPILEHDHMFLVGRNNIGTFLYATDGTGPFEIVGTLGQDGIFKADAAVHNGQVNKFVNYSNSTDGYQFYKITSGCPTLLTLTQNLTTSSDYYAQSIVSSSTINNNASILFSADMGTDLIDGFTVENLAQLEVLVNGCP